MRSTGYPPRNHCDYCCYNGCFRFHPSAPGEQLQTTKTLLLLPLLSLPLLLLLPLLLQLLMQLLQRWLTVM